MGVETIGAVIASALIGAGAGAIQGRKSQKTSRNVADAQRVSREKLAKEQRARSEQLEQQRLRGDKRLFQQSQEKAKTQQVVTGALLRGLESRQLRQRGIAPKSFADISESVLNR